MLNTLKMFKTICNKNLINEYTYEELSTKYKQTKSPQILATIFVENFSLFVSISGKFFYLSEEDKASFCTESLDTALTTFDNTKNVKFITYLYTVTYNNLRRQTQLLNTDKRKLNYDTSNISLEYIPDNSTVNNTNNKLNYELTNRNDFTKDILLNVAIDNNNFLNETEKDYCKLLMTCDTRPSGKDISSALNITSVWAYNLKRNLKSKLLQTGII